jgi:hypothetical protein
MLHCHVNCLRTLGFVLLLWVVTTLTASSVNAGLLTPNGNPTGPASAKSPNNQYTVNLNPSNATYNGLANPNLVDALETTCGISAENGWTVTFRNLGGDFTLGTYLAWTETMPGFTQGELSSVGAEPTPGAGGAAIGLNYTVGGTDPSQESMHWIQLIATNYPIGGTIGPTTWHIDAGIAGNPYYDRIGAANTTDFIDLPFRPYNGATVWKAYVFMAWGDLNAKVLNISNQNVGWGFTDPVEAVPEPSSLGLAVVGAFAQFFARLRLAIVTPVLTKI